MKRTKFPSFSFAIAAPPFLSDSDKQDLIDAVRQFRIDFVHGLLFSGTVEFLNVFLVHRPTSFDLPRSAFSCVRSARDLAAYPLVNSIAFTLLKPNLSGFRQWLPWTVASSLATATVLRTVNVASQNLDLTGRLSLVGWSDGAIPELCRQVGFQTVYAAADHWLPDPSVMGGMLAHSCAAMAIANLGDAIVSHVAQKRGSLTASYCRFLDSLPIVMFDAALFKAAAEVSKLLT
jgi:hypothetical protein